MTLASLAASSNISIRSITAFENGHKRPSRDSVLALARALELPPDFFAGPPIDEIPIESVSFRALSKMTALDRDAALGAGRCALLINEWIEDRFRLPPVNVPTLPPLDAEQAAERVRSLWGLGEAPVSNMIHLLEANGVRVFSLATDCRSVDAFSMWHDGKPFIFLNTTKSGERSRFDAAHELAHLVLHAAHRTPQGGDAEDEAQKFASAFLMPRAGIIAQALYDPTPDQVIRAKRRWKVAAVALAYRLHDVGLLSDWKYRMNVKALSQLGYRRAEPGGISQESSQLLLKVFRSLKDEDKGLRVLAEDLGLTAEELSRHVFGLVPTVIDGGAEPSPSVRPSLELLKSSG
jgi:Zn-dependent peptidase ImmA (M78 family)